MIIPYTSWDCHEDKEVNVCKLLGWWLAQGEQSEKCELEKTNSALQGSEVLKDNIRVSWPTVPAWGSAAN